MRWMLILLWPACVQAETLVASHTIRAHTLLSGEDLAVIAADVPGAMTRAEDLLGQEARVTLYPGRPIFPQDIGPAARVERNQIVPLVYQAGGLSILTEGRALGRGATGEMIRVMNLASRATLTGRVSENGAVHIGSAP